MKRKNKILSNNSREDVVSMILGLIIVGTIVALIFNFIQKRKGSVSVPGISNQISLGENVSVTPTEAKTKNEYGEEVYKVKKGDNLWDISVAIYGNGYKWVEIAKQNGLADADFLSVSQELVLPQVDKVAQSSGEYVVKKGDSLWDISVSLYGNGYKWVDVWNLNKALIFDPDILKIGTKLALP